MTYVTSCRKWLAVVLGFLGVIVCLVAMAVVWFTGTRIDRANTTLGATIDQTLETVEQRHGWSGSAKAKWHHEE